MNAQDREVVKNLLQYMTHKCLTGSDEFYATLTHFNITTTYCWTNENATKPYVVDVFYPECANFERNTFSTKEEAQEFEAQVSAQGDDE